MNFGLIEEIFQKEADHTFAVLPIVGCWRKYEQLGEEPAQYIEVDMIEFNSDGTGAWKQWNNTGFLESLEDTFTYRIQGRRIIFSYASGPKQYDVRDYRVVGGHLILIDDYGMPDEEMEVYNSFLPHKSKQRKVKN